jgi:O-antigen/teichoic acid export membrane protein
MQAMLPPGPRERSIPDGNGRTRVAASVRGARTRVIAVPVEERVTAPPAGRRPLRRPLRDLTGRLNPVHRDGLALVLSSGLTSAVGLLYWIVAARLFDPATVGVNSVALSTMQLLGGVAHLNLTQALLRFGPVAGRRTRRLMLSCYAVASVVAALVGLGYAAGAPLWAPQMVDAVGHRPLLVFFAVATPAWAIFTMQDYLLTALKRATVVPLENLVFALLKIGLLGAAVGLAYVGGIAASWVLATVVIVVAVNAWLLRSAIPRVAADEPVEPVRPRVIARFVRSDYAGATLWQLAMNGLPALVLARLGAEDAAVYGIVWTIALSLYLIPSGMAQSMIAHTAADPGRADAARRAMVRRSLMLVVPAAVVLSAGAYPVLWLFGEHYAQRGAPALGLAALSAVPQVVTAAAVAQARVQQRMRVLVALPGSLAVAVLVCAWVLMPVWGIAGVALSWLVVQLVGAAVLLTRARARRTAPPAA